LGSSSLVMDTMCCHDKYLCRVDRSQKAALVISCGAFSQIDRSCYESLRPFIVSLSPDATNSETDAARLLCNKSRVAGPPLGKPRARIQRKKIASSLRFRRNEPHPLIHQQACSVLPRIAPCVCSSRLQTAAGVGRRRLSLACPDSTWGRDSGSAATPCN